MVVLSEQQTVGNTSLGKLRKLKNIAIPEGVEIVGNYWFWDSAAESVTIPASVRSIEPEAFWRCENLRTVYVGDGCSICLSDAELPPSVEVRPVAETLVGGARLRDLRAQKSVVIPDGVQKIGDRWFYSCGVESVELPASVVEIGTEAFCGCRKLKSLTIQAENSKLQTIGERAFCKCGCLQTF